MPTDYKNTSYAVQHEYNLVFRFTIPILLRDARHIYGNSPLPIPAQPRQE